MSEHVFLKRPLTSTRGPALRDHFVIRMHEHLHDQRASLGQTWQFQPLDDLRVPRVLGLGFRVLLQLVAAFEDVEIANRMDDDEENPGIVGIGFYK